MFDFKDFDMLNQHIHDVELLQEPEVDELIEAVYWSGGKLVNYLDQEDEVYGLIHEH